MVGFSNFEVSTLRQELANLLLTLNLSLSRACVNILGTPQGEIEVELQLPQKKGVTWKDDGRCSSVRNYCNPRFSIYIEDYIRHIR